MTGIIAEKRGMTRLICPETGKVTPVTLLKVNPNTVLQVKTKDRDGVDAVVVGTKNKKNAKKTPQSCLQIRQFSSRSSSLEQGNSLDAGSLEGLSRVKVTGVSKGRGFAGVIKRHNFSRGPETHGSHHHREPGSVGMCAKPARILKGKKLPGHMGARQVSLRTQIVDIDTDLGVIAIRGAVPGSVKSPVFITPLS